MFRADFREFMQLLNAHAVRYPVEGSCAVGAHGRPRFTGDLDIWREVSPENAQRLLFVVAGCGFGSRGLTEQDFLTPEQIIQLGYPPLRIY